MKKKNKAKSFEISYYMRCRCGKLVSLLEKGGVYGTELTFYGKCCRCGREFKIMFECEIGDKNT